jgi:hypothetical protein
MPAKKCPIGHLGHFFGLFVINIRVYEFSYGQTLAHANSTVRYVICCFHSQYDTKRHATCNNTSCHPQGLIF